MASQRLKDDTIVIVNTVDGIVEVYNTKCKRVVVVDFAIDMSAMPDQYEDGFVYVGDYPAYVDTMGARDLLEMDDDLMKVVQNMEEKN